MITKIKNKQLEIISDFDINNNRLINVDSPIDSNDAVNLKFINETSVNYALGTGLYTGGLIQIIDDNTFNILAGIGNFVNPITKSIIQLIWTDKLNISIISFGLTELFIYIAIDNNSNIIQQLSKFTVEQRNSYVVLGQLLIKPSNRKLYSDSLFKPIFSRDLPSIIDIHINEGPKVISGNIVTPTDSNSFLDVSGGDVVGYSINSKYDLRYPNQKTLISKTHIKFFTSYYNGSTWIYGGDANNYDSIDTNHWSNGTTNLQVTTNNNYTLRILCRSCLSDDILFLIYPTQHTEYKDITSAESDLQLLGINIPNEILITSVPLCFLIVKNNATNLSDSTQCKIIQIKSISVSAGSVSNTAVNISYDNSDAINLDSTNVQDALSTINNKIESLDYVKGNFNMSAMTGTNIHLATSIPILNKPLTLVRVEVNGVPVNLGDGVKIYDCYFSSDNGITAKSLNNVDIGDLLFWNENTASYHLESDDSIFFIYLSILL